MCFTAHVWRSEDTGIYCVLLELSSGARLDSERLDRLSHPTGPQGCHNAVEAGGTACWPRACTKPWV